MVFDREKSAIVSLKNNLCLYPKLLPTNAIILMKKAWDESFANITTNKIAMSERGQNPFNRVLLQCSEICYTMTPAEKEKKE